MQNSGMYKVSSVFIDRGVNLSKSMGEYVKVSKAMWDIHRLCKTTHAYFDY